MRKFLPDIPLQDAPIKPEGDYNNAKKFHYISVGDHYFFYRWLLITIRYIPISNIARCFIRVDSCTSSCCCGKATFNSKSLVLQTLDGKQKKLWLDNELILNSIMDELKKKNKDIIIGYFSGAAQPVD